MNKKVAIHMAVKALTREIQGLAWDANMYEKYGGGAPHTKEAYEKREKIKEAIAVLEGLLEPQTEQGRLF